MSDYSASDSDRSAMDAIHGGAEIEVETPTGKIFRARRNENGLFIISTDSKLFAQTGKEAKDRLENALRSVGTEWSLRAESDQGGSE